MSIEERLNRLNPRQRQIIDQIASLFLLTPDVELDVDIEIQDVMLLYDAERYVDSQEPDLNEIKRLLMHGIAITQKRVIDNLHYRAWWLTFVLMQADLEMGFYFATGDQSYRRNAINMFGELMRILAKERQTRDVQRALEHVTVFKRRLEKLYANVKPELHDCLHLAMDYGKQPLGIFD